MTTVLEPVTTGEIDAGVTLLPKVATRPRARNRDERARSGARPRPKPRTPVRSRTRVRTRRRSRTWVLPLLLTFGGLVARSVITRGLWVDEAMSVAQAKMSFPGMTHHLSTLDVHPPLSHALLWVTIRLFGSGETAVRLPSILLGTLMVPAMYLAGREIYDRRTGLVAAAVGAVAPVAVWYSQEARMYAVLMLLAILGVWAQFCFFRTGEKRYALLMALFQAGIAWTMYLGVFFVIAQQAVMLLACVQRRKDRREVWRLLSGWAISIAVLVVLVAPLVPYVWTQAHGPNYTQFANTNTAGTGGEGLGIGLYTIITNGVWAILGYHSTRAITSIVAMWPVGVLAALLLLGRGRTFRTMALVTLVLIPGALLYLQGLRSAETFTLRYLSAVVPVLFLLVARLITRVVWSEVATWLVTGALIVGLSFALVDQQLNGENPRRYDFREALQAVTLEAGPDDVIVYAPTYLRDVITYYAPDIPKFDATGDLEIDTPGRVIVLGSFFEIDGMYEQIGTVLAHLRQNGRSIVYKARYSNVRVWVLR